MHPTILVIDPDEKHHQRFQQLLTELEIKVVFYDSAEHLPPDLDIRSYPLVIMDLDGILPTKRCLEAWRRENPVLKCIGLSQRTYHPHLGDLIDRYLFACIKKPVDPDELAYLLKSASFSDGQLEHGSAI
ncbi:MAG: hypothetical protein JJV98_00860 [Desulfosarcina sp.]|nr:hypothetical protein [Desulfobacterales bacterium]